MQALFIACDVVTENHQYGSGVNRAEFEQSDICGGGHKIRKGKSDYHRHEEKVFVKRQFSFFVDFFPDGEKKYESAEPDT